jgi:hypothetical protein
MAFLHEEGLQDWPARRVGRLWDDGQGRKSKGAAAAAPFGLSAGAGFGEAAITEPRCHMTLYNIATGPVPTRFVAFRRSERSELQATCLDPWLSAQFGQHEFGWKIRCGAPDGAPSLIPTAAARRMI